MRVESKLKWDDGLGEDFFDAAKEDAYKIAKKIAGTAKRLAPRGKTGNLRKGIVAGKTKKNISMAFVYSNAPHAHLIEYGHQLVRSGKKIGHVAAYPYLRPALSSNQGSGKVVFAKGIKKVTAKSGK